MPGPIAGRKIGVIADAGSDLAGLRTEAVLDGDEWVVNGQKTWTTLASDANWIFLLVRTDKAAKKQQGISFLLVPLDQPGVTVRPIINLEMHDEFCEVFFDDVRVPKDNLVGQVNQGWTMAKALLGFERIFLGSARQSAYALSRLRQLAERMGVLDNPISGEHAGLLDPIGGNRELHPSGMFIQARPTTIYGGTSEIQRGIIAKNVLGLPG